MSKVTDNLNTRLQYYGGNAEKRFINDKLTSLKRALIYSYQACTIELADGRQFRALLNPDKLKAQYDTKILSIPFSDVRLNPSLVVQDENENIQKTSDGLESINIKCGDVFTWVETGTHWLSILRHIEEDAYFRAEVRRCDQKCKIGDKEYWCYIRGPVETSVTTGQKSGLVWNNLNYSLTMYITKDEYTLANLHRFSKLKVQESQNYSDLDSGANDTWRPWKVVAVDPYYYDNIIQIALDEDFSDTIGEAREAEAASETTTTETSDITGPDSIKQFGVGTYEVTAAGDWSLSTDSNNVRFIGPNTNVSKVKIEIVDMKSNTTFKLTQGSYTKTITVEAL